MLENAKRGLLFSSEANRQISSLILNLDKELNFDAVIELLSIFHDLSNSRNSLMLSDITFTKESYAFSSRRTERMLQLLHLGFAKKVNLGDAARVANMSKESCSRFIKVHTGYTFTENLNEICLPRYPYAY